MDYSILNIDIDHLILKCPPGVLLLLALILLLLACCCCGVFSPGGEHWDIFRTDFLHYPKSVSLQILIDPGTALQLEMVYQATTLSGQLFQPYALYCHFLVLNEGVSSSFF